MPLKKIYAIKKVSYGQNTYIEIAFFGIFVENKHFILLILYVFIILFIMVLLSGLLTGDKTLWERNCSK